MDSVKTMFMFLEKNIFNTLTRKLACNILFPVLIQTVMSALLCLKLRSDYQLLAGSRLDPHLLQRFGESYQGAQGMVLALYVFSLLASVLAIFFLRYLVVRPMKQLSETLASRDLSRDMPLRTFDEIRDLSQNYNLFLVEMKNILVATQKKTLNIAVDCAKVINQVSGSKKNAKTQVDLAEVILSSSKEGGQAIAEITRHTHDVSASVSQNHQTAANSMGELQQVTGNIATVSTRLATFNSTVTASTPIRKRSRTSCRSSRTSRTRRTCSP